MKTKSTTKRKMKRKMRHKLRHIFRSLMPDYWLRNYPYSREWDAKLNLLLDTEHFIPIDEFTAVLGGVTVWVAGHPYASFRPYMYRVPSVQPRRVTVARAHAQLLSDSLSHVGHLMNEQEEIAELEKMLNLGVKDDRAH
jgi:hypothetical protein